MDLVIVFAQQEVTSLMTLLATILKVLIGLSLIISLGGMLLAAGQIMTGRVEYLKFAITGAALAALSWVILKTLFEVTGLGDALPTL